MLTQAEIDALLKGTMEVEDRDSQTTVNLAELMGQEQESSGGAASVPAREVNDASKKVQAYNFWSPDRFSKDQMRAVELVHEDFAERLTTTLPTFLRTNVKPRLVHTEQGRFHDFLTDETTNMLYHMITLAPLPGQLVLTISPNVCYMILEQVLGGKVEHRPRERTLTDIDQSLLRGLVENMLNDIKASWAKVSVLEPGLEDSTTNQHWVQMLMGNERVMLLAFELTIHDTTGTMSIYIPFTTLKPIANELNPHAFITGKKEQQVDPIARRTLMTNISKAYLPLKVTLGQATLSVREMVDLKIGDVIQLDTKVDQELVVKIANQEKLRGRLGRSGNRLAIQLTGVIRPETEMNM